MLQVNGINNFENICVENKTINFATVKNQLK